MMIMMIHDNKIMNVKIIADRNPNSTEATVKSDAKYTPKLLAVAETWISKAARELQ